MKEMRNILLVEDDVNISFMTKDHFEFCGYSVYCTEYGEDVQSIMKSNAMDLIILDIELKGKKNGLDVASELRSNNNFVPIIFTTCQTKPENIQKIFSFDNIDFMRKPTPLNELELRMKRFFECREKTCQNITIGTLSLNPEERIIQYSDKKFRINNYELKLLLKLNEQTNRVVPKNEIIQSVWFDNEDIKSKELSLNNLICNLRKIFHETDKRISIDTIRGHGYKLSVR